MTSGSFSNFSDAELRLVYAACEAFEAALPHESSASIENCVAAAPLEIRVRLLNELLAIELEFRLSSKLPTDMEIYLARFPDHKEGVRNAFRKAPVTDIGDPEGDSSAVWWDHTRCES
jgi:hypothetical protein